MWGHRQITLEDLNLEIFKRDRQASRETLSQRRIQSKTNTAAHDEYKCNDESCIYSMPKGKNKVSYI